jgi:hypothetical protein
MAGEFDISGAIINKKVFLFVKDVSVKFILKFQTFKPILHFPSLGRLSLPFKSAKLLFMFSVCK